MAASDKEMLADVVNYPGFETLRAALEATSIQEVLMQKQDFTLLAPSNEAFEKLAGGLDVTARASCSLSWTLSGYWKKC